MLNQLVNSLEFIVIQTKLNLHTLLIILCIPWTALILTTLDRHLLMLGILPRTWQGLLGILFAPLLHANFNHLFFNSIPLVVLSNFLLLQGLDYYLFVTAAITLLSGLFIWCFGKSGLHIGASSVITGYWALLVSNIYQQGTATAIILGLISIYYFMGIFIGIFPGKKGVSWEGHFFGLISGFLVGYLIHHVNRP